MRLPNAVEETIAEVLPSDDVFDRAEFNACDFINRNFPDESDSLSDIPAFLSRLEGRLAELETNLSAAIQEQSRSGAQAASDLAEAQKAMGQLSSKINEIQTKSEQSAVMVAEICTDITQLDYAKKHLQTTFTALKRLQMLVTAVDRLELMASHRNYRQSAELLQAIKQLFTYFNSYTHVEKISLLQQTVQTIQQELTSQILGDFQAVGPLAEIQVVAEDHSEQDIETQNLLTNLRAACFVIDALGVEVREKLIKKFCSDQLAPYQKLFGKGGESFGLDQAERRYPWFYRLLGQIDSHLSSVFPVSWEIGQRLCLCFCERTRAHLLTLFGQILPEDMDVTLLLKTLQQTIQFEKDCSARFDTLNKLEEEDDDDDDDNGNPSVEAIRRKYLKQKRLKQQQMQKEERTYNIIENETVPLHQQQTSIIGIISKSFDPYMTSYVELEKKNILTMMQQAMAEDHLKASSNDTKLRLLNSSLQLFAYIRNSVKRCTTLTTGQTFFNLHVIFQECLSIYATKLQDSVTKSSNTGSSGTGLLVLDSDDKESDNASNCSKEVEMYCCILNTADYCAETLPSLEKLVEKKIDVAFQDTIDYSSTIEHFYDVINVCMAQKLLYLVDKKLDAELGKIPKMSQWASLENVGDESQFVTDISRFLARDFIPILQRNLAPLYFHNFCDKFVSSFITKYLNAILRCKKVNEVATQQLLLDTYGLKTLLLQLPILPQQNNASSITMSNPEVVPARYTKYVTNEMSRVETVLKLIGTPADMLVQSFKIMWPEGDAENLQQIMAVKGLRKNDQQMLMEMLGMKHATSAPIISSANEQPSSLSNNKAKMEEKMNDMTENWKKNMQNFNTRFGFNK